MMHRVLKFYFDKDSSKHEIDYLGYVADILNEEGIIEIQTSSFSKLVPKLQCFLEQNKVRVVYPIVERKNIIKIDRSSGESFPSRKSPKQGHPWDALYEISCIRDLLPNENLTVTVVFLDAIETRMKQGSRKVGRKRTEKIDILPTKINSIIDLHNPKDYLSLLPEKLPPEFTASEFEKHTKIKGIRKQGALMLLLKLGVLDREKGDGRAYVYSLKRTE